MCSQVTTQDGATRLCTEAPNSGVVDPFKFEIGSPNVSALEDLGLECVDDRIIVSRSDSL